MPDNDILNVYTERNDKANSFYQPLRSKLARRYDFFRGVYRAPYAAHRNRVFIPFIFSIIESSVARMAQILLTKFPYVEFEGIDGGIARRNSVIISRQMQDAKMFLKMVDFLLSSHIYGTGVFRDGWSRIRGKEVWRELDENGKEITKSDIVTSFDGPQINVVDLMDFDPQPGCGPNLEKCIWAHDRRFCDITQLEADVALGKVDAKVLAEVKASSNPPVNVQDSYYQRYNLYRSQYDYNARATERYAAPVKIVDCFGIVPDEFRVLGDNMVYYSIINDKHIAIKPRTYPWDHRELPYHVHAPMRDPHYLHGVGKVEIVETLAYLANRFASQKADALDRLIEPAWLVNTMSGINDDTLTMRSGKVIQVDGSVGEDSIRALVPDMRGLEAAMAEIMTIWRQIQQGTGISEDTIMGLPTADRQTKAEFVGRQESALTRVMLEAKLAENTLENIANRWRKLNRQLLPLGKQFAMLGREAEYDFKTGLALPPESGPVNPEDLRGDYKAIAKGTLNTIGKLGQQQNFVAWAQTIQANPAAASALAWANILRYSMQIFDFPNPEEMLLKQEELQNGTLPDINQLALQGGGGAESGFLNLLAGGQ